MFYTSSSDEKFQVNLEAVSLIQRLFATNSDEHDSLSGTEILSAPFLFYFIFFMKLYICHHKFYRILSFLKKIAIIVFQSFPNPTYHYYNLCLRLFFLYSFHDFNYSLSYLFCTVTMIVRSAKKYYHLNKCQMTYFRLSKPQEESRLNCEICSPF